MANKKTVCMVQGVPLRNILGITAKNCDDRKVERHKTDDGKLCYDLEEVFNKCGDLVYNHLKQRFTTLEGDSEEELKILKLKEETRKLKLENDTKEGILVYAPDVAIAYTNGMKAVCDVLDAICSRVKMENPDVSPAILDSVAKCVADARNKAADYDDKGK